MVEVKYPKNNLYDGKRHQIKIIKIVNIDNFIILYGEEKKKIVLLMLEYSYEIYDWVMIPYNKRIIESLMKKENLHDVTELLRKELEGKKITNCDELNYYLMEENNEVTDDNQNNKKVCFTLNEIEKEKNKLKSEKNYIIEKTIPLDIIELFTINRKRAFNLISDFIKENEKIKDLKYKKIVMNLITKLFDALLEYPMYLYTEDDLIELGIVLHKLSYQNYCLQSEQEKEEIFNKGSIIIKKLSKKI